MKSKQRGETQEGIGTILLSPHSLGLLTHRHICTPMQAIQSHYFTIAKLYYQGKPRQIKIQHLPKLRELQVGLCIINKEGILILRKEKSSTEN
jgi:hypothetical protein